MSTYRTVSEIPPHQIWKGAVARPIHGDLLTLGIIDLDPGILVPEHKHENEQLGFVLQGQVTMVIAGDARVLQIGGTYRIPSGVPHSAEAGPEGATVVDVFAPVRADWKTAPLLDPSVGMWPPRESAL